MKQQVLQCITDAFEQWLTQWDFHCEKGCCVCCTQNVTVTGLEVDSIVGWVEEKYAKIWLEERLQAIGPVGDPGSTTNEFATQCFENQNVTQPDPPSFKACPFLDNQLCTIYNVRPFNCRCFVSFSKCGENQPAIAHDPILSASTAVMQIIEHLDQGGRWGNVLDLLRLETGYSNNDEQLKSRIKKCLPLPGFLIPPEDYEQVRPLLESIFSAKINGKSLEDILNGK